MNASVPFLSFDKVLVANRGEIACRIIRGAAALGLNTVAVYSDADRGARHVHMADQAVRLGPPPARDSYLRADAILEACVATGAQAVHPGYGFLSEDAGFAVAVEQAGLTFVGPTPAQLDLFGAKHTAREAAAAAGVPMLAGTGILADEGSAVASAAALGYPVMLKATGGGGGIGMRACRDADELVAAFASVTRIAEAGFATSGVYLERLVTHARHVEVQVFGDGRGRVVILGDRDCSLQRRHQKVIEEAPAPALPAEVRRALTEHSARLAASVAYRSAGTVEYLYDQERAEISFLEVNTRLQVEHPVTEVVWGVDLVGAMLRLAGGDGTAMEELAQARPSGHAFEARIYAEDPCRDHRPSPGIITQVSFPPDVRVDTWVEVGSEVTSAYDPLLAKVVVAGADRGEALTRLTEALARTSLGGIETNVAFLAAASADEGLRAARHTTSTLSGVADRRARIEVRRPGTQTTVQDWPGRIGYWHVGVPPSGPMDDRSFRLANLAVGNPEGAPALEVTLTGPSLWFSVPALVCVAGAPSEVGIDGEPAAMWEPLRIPPGATLDVGRVGPPGLRCYVAIAGGLEVPTYLGSAATFTLGAFGGHGGRALVAGDVLHPGSPSGAAPAGVPASVRPSMGSSWHLNVVPGPHADGEFFVDVDDFYEAAWQVHFNSARTGLRLTGPRPRWARTDGGDAGLHPSNIHDTPYAVGALDMTGDLPILLGPDGPSLGGFVCPLTVGSEDLWKLGQLRPGDQVRFGSRPDHGRGGRVRNRVRGVARSGILARTSPASGTSVTYRASGDRNLLVEFGPMTLDLGLRARVHALAERLAAAEIEGLIELTPGVRSLQVQVDPAILPVAAALDLVGDLEGSLPPTDALEVPSREVLLPLSWDDPATRDAIARYSAGVRNDAPWSPWNIEFIRRINGLDDIESVSRIVYDASYLVLGLGDVYLGAPLATPVDPRHRLVTTKYNPARTWTAENSVGIGGAYLCIYGMEGPGGYQLVGRTVQVWSRYRQEPPFEPGVPWLLRFFDRIRWYPVSAEDLLDARADMAAGRFPIRIEDQTFRLAEYFCFLADHEESIRAFRSRQSAAFETERRTWEATGELNRPDDPAPPAVLEVAVPVGGYVVAAPVTGSIWKVEVVPGDVVQEGKKVLVMESMKTEFTVTASATGVAQEVLVTPGDQVSVGQALLVVGPRP